MAKLGQKSKKKRLTPAELQQIQAEVNAARAAIAQAARKKRPQPSVIVHPTLQQVGQFAPKQPNPQTQWRKSPVLDPMNLDYTIAGEPGRLVRHYDGKVTWESRNHNWRFSIPAGVMEDAADPRGKLLTYIQGMAIQIKKDKAKPKDMMEDLEAIEREVAGWYEEG